MGIFNKLFGGNEGEKENVAQKTIPWKMLTQLSQLEEIVTESQSKPVVIFKHSTSCGISRMVLKQFESQYNFEVYEIQPYYLDLKAYRDVSNEVGYKFQVMHQSPQLLLIKNGTSVYADSHGAISVSTLRGHL